MVYSGSGPVTNSNYFYSGVYFKQTADLDLSAYYWQPIGIQYNRSGTGINRFFSGNYDGDDHTVSGVFTPAGSTNAYSNQGLFGIISSFSSVASISNVGIIDSYIQGSEFVGGIAGCTESSEITNCYNAGQIYGTEGKVGGIVGYNFDTSITNCYNTGTIYGQVEFVGGIVGHMETSAPVLNCYNAGTVDAQATQTGGIAGYNDSTTFANCYNTGSVTGDNRETGGIIGKNDYGEIVNCFNTGSVDDIRSEGGGAIIGFFVGGDFTNCYYDSGLSLSGVSYWEDQSFIDTTIKVENLNTTSYAKSQSWYTNSANWDSSYKWDFENTWTFDNSKNDGYPIFKQRVITWQDFASSSFGGGNGNETTPYLISTPNQLALLAKNVNAGESYIDKHFKQTADINLGGHEWVPIGNSSAIFKGKFNGSDKIISGLSITDTTLTEVGLFGRADNSTIENVHLRNSVITSKATGGSYIGSVVGTMGSSSSAVNDGIIKNCSSNAILNATSTANIGGIVGIMRGELSECIFNGKINGGESATVGGIVAGMGWPGNTTNVTNCVCTGNLTGSYVGGIVGSHTISGVISNSIFDGIISGRYIGSIVASLGGYSTCQVNDCAGFGMLYVTYPTSESVGAIVGYANNSSPITNCSFIGSSNVDIDKFIGKSTNGAQYGVINSSYMQVNENKKYSSGDFSGWTIVKNMNNNLPMQNALYSVAIGGQTSEYVLSELNNKGFTLLS